MSKLIVPTWINDWDKVEISNLVEALIEETKRFKKPQLNPLLVLDLFALQERIDEKEVTREEWNLVEKEITRLNRKNGGSVSEFFFYSLVCQMRGGIKLDLTDQNFIEIQQIYARAYKKVQ